MCSAEVSAVTQGSPFTLASGSPRRKELLARAGFRFRVWPPDVDERPAPQEAPEALVQRLAREKAHAVADASEPGVRVLAADTIVVLDDQILGKPRDAADARAMLARLSGRTHRVLTGYALVWHAGGVQEAGLEASQVHFRTLTPAEAHAYVETGESLDKAGAYAVQGRAGTFVTHIAGSRSNVIGLPMEVIVPLLARHGVLPT